MRGQRPYQPWEVVALDLIGPYPKTARGKTGILVVTDLFTRWVEAFAIPEATSGRILQLLKTEVFSRYGYPRCILSYGSLSIDVASHPGVLIMKIILDIILNYVQFYIQL